MTGLNDNTPRKGMTRAQMLRSTAAVTPFTRPPTLEEIRSFGVELGATLGAGLVAAISKIAPAAPEDIDRLNGSVLASIQTTVGEFAALGATAIEVATYKAGAHAEVGRRLRLYLEATTAKGLAQ